MPVQEFPVSQTRGHQDQPEELLVLMGLGSVADDVLTFLREMWPEVEAAERVPVSASRR
jgi:hypothetical protein